MSAIRNGPSATDAPSTGVQRPPRSATVNLPFVTAEFRMPQVHLPTVHLPAVHLPAVHLPAVHLPAVHLPAVRPPSLPTPGSPRPTQQAPQEPAPAASGSDSPLFSRDRLVYYLGLGALAALEVIEWPVAVAIGVGTAIAGRRPEPQAQAHPAAGADVARPPGDAVPVATTEDRTRRFPAGDVRVERGFHFRGEDGLDLTAQNLQEFMKLGDDLDDAAWQQYLRQGDYARWFRDVLGDDALADEAEDIRRRHADDPDTSRALLWAAIERRLGAPV
jgi:hypothetical protein